MDSLRILILAAVLLTPHSSWADEIRSVRGDGIAPARIDPPAEPKIERYAGTMDISTPQANSSKERAQAVAGSAYTVITPLFLGNGNNYSFIRFMNGASTTSTYFATVVGSPSARNYGTATVTVAPFASPQYSISDILSVIGVSGTTNGDCCLSIYLKSSNPVNTAFQHVVWNSTTGFFENASICTYTSTVSYENLNRILVNVHTSRIPAYPGIIFLHNYASFPVSYRVDIFNARTGAYLGNVFFNLGANDTGSEEFSQTEKTLGWTPGPNDYHVNMVFSPSVSGATYYGLGASAINNLQLNSLTNMSVACIVNN